MNTDKQVEQMSNQPPLRVLKIDASSRYDGSVTRQLANDFITQLQKQHEAVVIQQRDVVSDALAFLDADWVNANFTPVDQRSEAQLAVLALLSVAAKEWIYHYTMRVAVALKSEMLKANAWHSRSDAISSIIVVFGVAGTMAGLPYLDAIAAVGVGLMVAHIGWELGWQANARGQRGLTDIQDANGADRPAPAGLALPRRLRRQNR